MKTYRQIITLIFLFCIAQLYSQDIKYHNNDLSKYSDGDIIITETGNYLKGESIDKSHVPYCDSIAGVFQETENILITLSEEKKVKGFVINSSGIFNIKYNSENGPIKKGDYITSSSEDGVGMRATKSGTVIGVALEDASLAKGYIKTRICIQYIVQ